MPDKIKTLSDYRYAVLDENNQIARDSVSYDYWHRTPERALDMAKLMATKTAGRYKVVQLIAEVNTSVEVVQ